MGNTNLLPMTNEALTEVIMLDDVWIAKRYYNKFQDAKKRGLEFDLTFAEFKRICLRKRCQLSGLPLDATNRTVDRVDNKIGYVKGNCVACHNDVNNLKSLLENPNMYPEVGVKEMFRALSKTVEIMENNNANC